MPVGPMPPVVVGLDGSAASFAALDLAAEEAAGRVTPLEIVYVQGSTVEDAGPAGEMLANAVSRVGADHPCLSVRGVFVLGDPVEGLLQHLDGACVGVLGYRGTGGSRPVGPVAVRVADRAPVPVIVSRPFDHAHADAAPRAVLVGVDGLPCSEAAVAFAFEEAALRGAPVEVHHVWWQPAGAGVACCFPEAVYPDGADLGHARREARRLLAGIVDTWSAKYREVALRGVVDGTAETLLGASHDAQLVVVGAHAHAQAGPLIERAGCSVAVTQGS
jgi:nucleotide-binding universal stress UspA family protein